MKDNPKLRSKFLSIVFTKDNVTEFGFENLLQQLAMKLGTNDELPTCEVRLDNVTYAVDIPSTKPNEIPSTLRIPKLGLCSGENTIQYNILDRVNAIFKPGSMTLVRIVAFLDHIIYSCVMYVRI